MSSSSDPIVTYNWDPATQLASLIADEAAIADGSSSSGATITFLGDSTTDGFGTAPSNYIATTSLPAQVSAGLAADGVSANQADFMGQGNELQTDTDARVTLLGEASWNFPMAAGGEIVRFSAAGDGLTFTPDSSGSYKSVTLDYLASGGGTLDLSVNGQDLGDVTTGNSGLLDQVTVDLPTTEAVSSITITDVNGATAYIEGVTLQSASPSVQVIDAGVGGAESSIVGTGQSETNPYNVTAINAVAAEKPTVAFVDFGINDVLQGNLTAAQTTANLQLIVQELQASGTEPIIVIPNPVTSPNWGIEIATLRADVYALATQLNLPVIDLSATGGDNAAALETQGLLNSDGVHPTAAYDASVGRQIAALLTGASTSSSTIASSGATVTTSTSTSASTSTSSVAATPVSTRTVVSASAFLDSLGVNTHISYTDGGYANVSNVLSDLHYIGVSSVRDQLSNGYASNGQYNGSAPLSSFETLAQVGIKFTTLIGSGGSWTPQMVQNALALDDQLQQAVPGAVTAVEGVNEINNAPVTWTGADGATASGLQAAVDIQSDVYAAVHGDTNLAGVAVDYFTGYGAGSDGQGPDPTTQAGLADFDTQHPYPQSADAAYWVSPTTALTNEPDAQSAAVYTETGYSTDSVSQLAQAQGDLNILMDDAKDGISETFLYQLLDAYQPGSVQGDDGYGLFDSNNQPKLAATALHDLTTILADPNASSSQTVAAPDFTVSGLPSDGNTLAIEKSDGTQDFVVWNETSGTQNVTVNLGADYQSVSIYNPLQGSTPIETRTDVSSVVLTLDGSPLIVQVSPELAPASVVEQGTGSSTTTATPVSGTSDSPPVVTLGSGPDTLALQISQDYYLADAQFVVDVNGQQVGGVQTVDPSALHSSGVDQTFNLLGDFSTSQVVSVSFINDAYAGTPETDRNLYVDNATIHGTPVNGAADALLGDWTDTFNVVDPVASSTGTASTVTSTPGSSTTPIVTSQTGGGTTSSAGDASTSMGSSTTATPVSGASDSPPVVTLGSGPDTLALQISQDYYLADAQFVVDVNGQQVGGVQTVDPSALHSSGVDQMFNLQGNFSGSPNVTVDFLNDAYAGTPETDRNLYVDSATINGTAINNATLFEYSGGPQSFSFIGPQQSADLATSPDVGLYLSGTSGAEAQWSIDGGALSEVVQPTSGSTAEAFDIGSLTPGVHHFALYQIPNSTGANSQALNVTQITVGSSALASLQYGTVSNGVTHFALNIPSNS
jgi:lysophospholipase L1-like esterase